jgi:hypothetical protein
LKAPSRRVTAVIFVALLALVGVSLYQQYSVSAPAGPWHATTSYPLANNGAVGVAGQPCLASNDTIYCIGGQDVDGDPNSQVYTSSLTSGGLGNWSAAGSYPTDVMFQPCVSYGGYAYCVGGSYDDSADDVAFAYYAPISTTGLGQWSATTSYPIPADSQACVASSGYIYCLGGENETAGTNATSAYSSSAWYAPLSSSGIGAWNRTTAYPSPVYFPSCAGYGGYIYCVGGESSTGTPQSSAYYATLSSKGIGHWTATTAYPFQGAGQDCLTSSSYIYCIGGWSGGSSYTGDVFYALISPDGIGTWEQAGAYPVGLTTACVLSPAGYAYCIGGYAGSSGPVPSTYYGLLTSQPVPGNSTSSG